MFCTNCGNEVHEKAVVCPKCGVPPKLENKFCNGCGHQIGNPNQVICTNCGVAVGKGIGKGQRAMAGLTASGSRSRVIAIVLALCLGVFGGHKFYNGSWGWGIVYIVAVLTVYGTFITFVAMIVEVIAYCKMSDAEYDEQYNQTLPSPFKW